MRDTVIAPLELPSDPEPLTRRIRPKTRTSGSVIRKVIVAIREILLTLAALGGVICIVLVALAFTGGYSLILFKTGSMSPTIPAGSVALVKEVPANQVQVGDVLTVDRPGALPVTHRITSVAAGASDTVRVITMKGDANDKEDPAPYSIEHGRLVIVSVPHLANVIVWFGNPLVLGGIAIGASLLVTWAFWPRDPIKPEGKDIQPLDGSDPTPPAEASR